MAYKQIAAYILTSVMLLYASAENSAAYDHWAHDFGMDAYVQFFKDNSDKGIEKIVNALKNTGEFDNKIFIILADHGMTVMPIFGLVQFGDRYVFPDDSCKLTLKDFDDKEIQDSEKSNNNLHIWELGEVLKAVGSIQNTVVRNKYKVLTPKDIADIFIDENGNELPAGATSKIENAHIIAALNGPMAHIYVNSSEIGQVAETLRLMLQMEDTADALQWLGLEDLDYKQIRTTTTGKLQSSIDKILVRVSGDYCVFDGINSNGTPKCASTDPFISTATEYVDAWARITGLNNPGRSGDIILIMKDSTAGNAIDRYTTGVACKSWHGSLNPSDSYVPLIISYPGGNKKEIEPLINNTDGCKVDTGCDGNWRVKDLIKTIVNKQYEMP